MTLTQAKHISSGIYTFANRQFYLVNDFNKHIDKIYADFKLELEAEYKRGQEDVLSGSCEGCKWDYTIANRDEDGNVIDDMLPSSCYICSRNMPDKWKQK